MRIEPPENKQRKHKQWLLDTTRSTLVHTVGEWRAFENAAVIVRFAFLSFFYLQFNVFVSVIHDGNIFSMAVCFGFIVVQYALCLGEHSKAFCFAGTTKADDRGNFHAASWPSPGCERLLYIASHNTRALCIEWAHFVSLFLFKNKLWDRKNCIDKSVKRAWHGKKRQIALKCVLNELWVCF